MTLIEDSHEGQTVVVCAPDSSCIDSDIGIGSWSICLCIQTLTVVESRLNTDHGRDSASRVMCGDFHLLAFFNVGCLK